MTLIILPFTQIVPDRYTVIEHKTVALPKTVFLRHLFQIFQNTTLKMIDLFEALIEHEARRFLAADTTSAEHGHFFMTGRIKILPDILRKLAEGFVLGIHRIGKGPDTDLVIIARINQYNIRV